jgi:hypothetical protein
MNTTPWIARWLGADDVTQVDGWRTNFGAAWAQQAPAAVWLGMLVVAAVAVAFYLRFQPPKAGRFGALLALLRATSLALLVLILADPILEVTLVRSPEPILWVGLDASDSLQIADELPAEQRAALDAATSRTSAGPSAGGLPRRVDDVRAFLAANDGAWLKQLRERFRVQLFALSGPGSIDLLTMPGETPDDPPRDELERWNPAGSVTALGDALEELARRPQGGSLAGLVLVSDFDQNSGTAPEEQATRLGVPIFPIGVGPESAVDLSVDLLVPPTMKQTETSTLSVTVRQRELEQTSVTVRLWAEPLGTTETTRLPLGERRLDLTGATAAAEFPFTPDRTGRFIFVAEVEPVAGETITQNNQSRREARIIDDFLRLLFVEYEPTWEWRFIKEVFHRDKLVGTRGFRTFLRSADPVVRETNELFVSNLTLPRHEFFAADVIFLGDLPASALSTRFGEMTREFVDQFGGGLVVLAGPRFGPGQLAETPLADMLPVVVDPAGRRQDGTPFAPRLTPFAGQYDFMRLGSDETAGGLSGWSNLGTLPWYQPVQRVDPRATVLAEHPTAVCADGETKQPLLAIRPYGRGEVVYVGFNELWRLRRLRGEEYYRQFWGQLIHRLGLSHALGDQKRFVVRTDRRQYRSGDNVVITVEAYDEDFQPLAAAPSGMTALEGEWLRPAPDDAGNRSVPLTIPPLRPGVFETRLTVTTDGEHRLRVTDPVTNTPVDVVVQVADLSIERRNPVRNVALQQSLATATGGRSYDLTTARRFLEDFQPPRPRETSIEVFPLWNNWGMFAVLAGLLLAEWALRKGAHLP